MAPQSLSEAEVNNQSDGHHVCIVCFGDFGTDMRRAKLPCGHNDMCGICHLRLRYLHEDKKCPICKQTNETIIVDNDDTKTFDSYPRWGDDIGAGFVYKADVGMFFEEKYYNEAIVPLYEMSCNKCNFKVDENIFINQHLNQDGEDDEQKKGGNKRKKKPRKLLEEHLKKRHRLSMCHLCIDHKRDFISQLPRFTQSQLQNHMKNGDGPGSGFSGHPICEFCRPKRFYDVNFLHKHLHTEHYKCHICEKQGLDNQWFKNYKSLARHFDKQHFMCHHPQCQAARFVVFENELDLRAHEISVHGGTSTGSTKINLEFNIRRATGTVGERQHAPSEADFNYDLDGQAFVPPALADNNANMNGGDNNNRSNESSLHPQHVQRTEELRAHAAAIREQQALDSQGVSFPTLQSAAAPSPSSAPLVGWTSGTALQSMNRSNRNIGEVTQEAFPSLQPNTSNHNKKKAAIKGTIGATRRQFAAMSTSANQSSWAGSHSAINAAAPVRSSTGYSNFLLSATPTRQVNRQADLSADNFPSLGGSTSSSRPANTMARRAAGYAPPPSLNSIADFPSMQSNGTNSARARATNSNLKKPPPSMNSSLDFPAPPSARQPAKPSVRDQLLGNSDQKMPAQNNILRAEIPAASSASASAKATVEDMKASLGQKNFKQLKKFTKAFAQEELSAEGYVDQAAALFEKGYDDSDFWSYLPSLLESCPNQTSAQHALKYMNSLKRQQITETTAGRSSSAFAAAARSKVTKPSQWGGAYGNNSNVMRQVVPPPTRSIPSIPARPLTQPVTGVARAQTMASKKKSAWGAGGKTTVVRTKAPPGSVSVAAADQGPQGGTATKFMAKQQKQQKQQTNANSNKTQQQTKAKKKKQKNELRDLAFGR